MELVELDNQLRQAHTNINFPQFPITPDTLTLPPPKRKSTFLNTLSRLASPTSAKSHPKNSTSQRNNNNNLNSPFTPSSPAIEHNDPFTSFSASNGDLPRTATAAVTNNNTSTLSTSIAAYLTVLSNILVLRQDRYWKRFTRVRTDDLESVRIERAIKRVRSDLAAHGGSLENPLNGHSADPSENGSIRDPEEQPCEEPKPNGDVQSAIAIRDMPASMQDEGKETDDQSPVPIKEDYVPGPTDTANATDGMQSSVPNDDQVSVIDNGGVSPTMISNHDNVNQEAVPSSSTSADLPLSRMHRSKSADPHKFSRLPRTYTSSAPSQNGAESQTGDESSSSKNGQSRRSSARKKRSASTAAGPKEPKKSQRKVVIDDFEMMRVLGKGCAGKVLLVRHKQTSDLFALKAITKRHVLAHQELQHTLTEQAVLKRMAAESRDPFVVKLWWSFHDKENLFLVMVRFIFLFEIILTFIVCLGFPPRR